jgi:thiamine phosphate synthase YjbQ (UPF0047 family)
MRTTTEVGTSICRIRVFDNLCIGVLDVRRGKNDSILRVGAAQLRVPQDMDMALDNIVPETLNWRHTDEGPE